MRFPWAKMYFNTVYVLGLKYILGPSQSHCNSCVAQAQAEMTESAQVSKYALEN